MDLLDDETRWPNHQAVVLDEMRSAILEEQVQAREA
jgi:hypothetical protein